MNNVDRVLRDSKILLDSAKDNVAKNLMSAIQSNILNLDEAQLAKVISVVNLSIDEGYLRALPVFQNAVNRNLSNT